MSRPPVWQMVKEAVINLGGKTTYAQIRDFIRGKYGDVNESTITCQTIVCSVNHPSRIHYPENQRPRKCDAQYDFLYNTGRGKVELYDPDTHGLWEICVNPYGKLEVTQAELGEEDETGLDPVETDGLAFPLEHHLRDFIAVNIETIRLNGEKLQLYRDASGRDGIEYPTDVGPIDILAQDTVGNLIVFELKLSKGADRAIGQILRYMGWVQKHLAGPAQVRGIIVASTIDEKLQYAVSLVPSITVFEYTLRFDLKQIALQ
jgi:RecB family endonuclease NucS